MLSLLISISAFFVIFLLMSNPAKAGEEPGENDAEDSEDREGGNPGQGVEKATFAGGCFWCMELPFKRLDGVKSVTAGYTGGHVENPTYREVTTGTTGHYEAVQIVFDPEKTGYEELLDIFWRQIDPTDPGGQFADRGTQYKTVIFYHDEEQKKKAEESKKKLDESGKFKKPVATEILPAQDFYPAEDYHQDYPEKNRVHYGMYKQMSGRGPFLEKTWGGEKDKNSNKEVHSFKDLDEASRNPGAIDYLKKLFGK